MRKISMFVLVVFMTAIAGTCLAEEPVVYFEMPPDLMNKACKDKVWAGVAAKWEGVTDLRESKAVGLQTKKGGEEIRVYSNPALDVVMNDALQDIFRQCGMALVEKVPADGIRIKANIKEFFVDVIKNVVSSRTEAQSVIMFDIHRGKHVESIDVGMTIEYKGMRNRKIKGIQKAANKLMAETLAEIPKNRHMKEIR